MKAIGFPSTLKISAFLFRVFQDGKLLGRNEFFQWVESKAIVLTKVEKSNLAELYGMFEATGSCSSKIFKHFLFDFPSDIEVEVVSIEFGFTKPLSLEKGKKWMDELVSLGYKKSICLFFEN
jgi:hypothetical protein